MSRFVQLTYQVTDACIPFMCYCFFNTIFVQEINLSRIWKIKFRNLSGGKATSGNNETTQDVLQLITTYILDGYAIRKVEAFNDRIYLSRYRRNYWLGTKYYYMIVYLVFKKFHTFRHFCLYMRIIIFFSQYFILR